ncbi:hypothetical protein E2C01_001918 [Portunus trituberculatus]|uniref:Uncharacterized protein n=1 Tax=Portunus trituberculatus TaxID=210409 RepID=A0A5B7CIU5_PORTR|nr:hypothetical protein [Portunus trituberculatus]
MTGPCCGAAKGEAWGRCGEGVEKGMVWRKHQPYIQIQHTIQSLLNLSISLLCGIQSMEKLYCPNFIQKASTAVLPSCTVSFLASVRSKRGPEFDSSRLCCTSLGSSFHQPQLHRDF